MNEKAIAARRGAKLHTPNRLGEKPARDIAGALNALLADFFALYLKTKNFHWHVSGPHFRDYHLLLDEQADQPTPRPIRSRNACASWVGRPCARSAISPGYSALRTTTRNM